MGMSKAEEEEQVRLERARAVGLFRYMLIREAADPALSTRQRGKLVREIAAREHTVEGLAVSGLRKLCFLKPLPAIPGTRCGPPAEAGTRSPSVDASDCSAVRCSVQYHAWPFRESDRPCGTRAPS